MAFPLYVYNIDENRREAKFIKKVDLRNTKWSLLFLICSIVSVNAFGMFQFGRFHGKGNLELVQHLRKSGVIKSERVFDAMSKVDRGKYTEPCDAYIDSPQSIGFGATISAPHMHGYALEFLADKLKDGSRALDVGSGSGYLTACMALMVGPKGVAVGIEHVPKLQERARRNIQSDHPELLESKQLELIVGDGRLGYPNKAPYDAIHIGAAAPEAPEILINQLAPGGRMIVPIGKTNADQTLFQIDKTMDGKIQKTSLMGVVYVPLCDKSRQGYFIRVLNFQIITKIYKNNILCSIPN
ncbi:protein-L-isoaspartate(D-aspartate) O-methyltransferase [Nasonia vitripennis]|uniref:Protein-L-isoaspartate O-methyltransferase n=1 Tax=Nasonia vitripennis TaxID=7425 RepID=A0A7M7R0T4_NASVI|nr:protein-L-isoaspartate(D-aspartate) O-methyltransferase [Nasonia vitripennis]XP_032457609.1 protein-L-isoaspartate(D-aspartate) O-methyltransferase [Nasonia vitripennis]